MRFYYALIFLLTAGVYCNTAWCLGYKIRGQIIDVKNSVTLPGASVVIAHSVDSSKNGTVTDTAGHFSLGPVKPGKYNIIVSYIGYESYRRSVNVIDANVDLGKINLEANATLNEVKIVDKILAVAQKGDTTEFNAGAYKTHPDADASDLVRKMPGMDVNGKDVKAQGESVTKVLIDGKPFFGTDPYASLKNLPAEVIDKVQVYNEKSDQEKFTGFSEGTTTKTINIITKPDKRNGEFGKAFTGYGSDNTYLAGGNINDFDDDRRISITAQTNDINTQNIGDQNITGLPGGGGGIATTKAAGINYNDKWGKKIDVSGSYTYNESDNQLDRITRRQYILAADSGQVYNETSNSDNRSYSHNFYLRLNYNIDSSNSLLIQPNLSLQKAYSPSSLSGNTKQADTMLNQTINNSSSSLLGYNFSNNLLFRHKFKKAGRTFSINANANNSHNDDNSHLNAQNLFFNDPTLNNNQDQQTISKQNTWALSANANYTEPSGKNGLFQLQYDINYIPALSDRNVYNYSNATESYTIPDTSLSNTFSSRNIAHKGGGSYMLRHEKYEFSIGTYYQLTELSDNQQLPDNFQLSRTFSSFLPIAYFQYKISKTKNLRFSYNTSTYAPSVTQLQNVINNSNQLQLYTGNPDLKQPYQHHFDVHYNATNTTRSTNFFISISGNLTQNYITNNSIIADKDTLLQQNIILPKGSQLTMPVNINGYWSLSAYSSYGMPLKFIKSNLNFNANVNWSRMPAIINSQVNYGNTKAGSIGINLNSNISENVDFMISSSTSLNSDINSLNANINTLYINQANHLTLNLIFWKGFVYQTDVSYEHNSGLSQGFNQDYAVWNMSVGKKFFRKRQGDLRLTVYDLLKENNNIQHLIYQTYIQDMQTTTLQRYLMLTFTYNIRNFRK